MVVVEVERSEIRAALWEMDLSGGTAMVPRSLLAGSIRTLSRTEGSYLKLGQVAVVALREVSQHDRADARPLQGEQIQAHGRTRPAYYAITALVDGEGEGGFAG